MKRSEANTSMPTAVLPYYASGEADQPLRKCPDDPHEIQGCGHVFRADEDDEGFINCPNCGMWFRPTE